mmetsp:Transcript_79048/g.124791  ORF Transcript_79048/g.124791 Transcript_79048/m.124791 type:complete len:203 (+) Transcript_79048:350-958(+)
MWKIGKPRLKFVRDHFPGCTRPLQLLLALSLAILDAIPIITLRAPDAMFALVITSFRIWLDQLMRVILTILDAIPIITLRAPNAIFALVIATLGIWLELLLNFLFLFQLLLLLLFTFLFLLFFVHFHFLFLPLLLLFLFLFSLLFIFFLCFLVLFLLGLSSRANHLVLDALRIPMQSEPAITCDMIMWALAIKSCSRNAFAF